MWCCLYMRCPARNSLGSLELAHTLAALQTWNLDQLPTFLHTPNTSARLPWSPDHVQDHSHVRNSGAIHTVDRTSNKTLLAFAHGLRSNPSTPFKPAAIQDCNHCSRPHLLAMTKGTHTPPQAASAPCLAHTQQHHTNRCFQAACCCHAAVGKPEQLQTASKDGRPACTCMGHSHSHINVSCLNSPS